MSSFSGKYVVVDIPDPTIETESGRILTQKEGDAIVFKAIAETILPPGTKYSEKDGRLIFPKCFKCGKIYHSMDHPEDCTKQKSEVFIEDRNDKTNERESKENN